MASERLTPSRLSELRRKNSPVFCVGWRAFVHWPSKGARERGPVPVTDASGEPMINDLADGEQVEILAWQPRSREGLLYQIKRLADSSEWWIRARHLRRQPVAEGMRTAKATAPAR